MPNYLPIENHGVIGDMKTIALVGIKGCIDFMCFPDFDSPTIFASLLDKDKGGFFAISSSHEDLRTKQLYLPDTNVLLTRFLSDEGVGELTDFMPIEDNDIAQTLARRVTAAPGEMSFTMTCRPRFNYARSEHEVEQVNDFIEAACLARAPGKKITAPFPARSTKHKESPLVRAPRFLRPILRST